MLLCMMFQILMYHLASRLVERGITNVVMYDVSNTHVSQLISETFKYSHIVLASVTYNLGIYPLMHNYLMDMKALNVQNRTVAIVENGSWACKSGDLMAEFLDGMKQMYPLMHNYLMDMKALNVQNRTVAIVENGSWACKSGDLMAEFLDGMKQMSVLNERLTVVSSLSEEKVDEMEVLIDGIVDSMKD